MITKAQSEHPQPLWLRIGIGVGRCTVIALLLVTAAWAAHNWRSMLRPSPPSVGSDKQQSAAAHSSEMVAWANELPLAGLWSFAGVRWQMGAVDLPAAEV